MLFVTLCKARAGTPKEIIARRAQLQPPKEARVVAEY
jgi:hypothetical protein